MFKSTTFPAIFTQSECFRLLSMECNYLLMLYSAPQASFNPQSKHFGGCDYKRSFYLRLIVSPEGRTLFAKWHNQPESLSVVRPAKTTDAGEGWEQVFFCLSFSSATVRTARLIAFTSPSPCEMQKKD